MKTVIILHCRLRSRLSAAQPGMWGKDRAPGQPAQVTGKQSQETNAGTPFLTRRREAAAGVSAVSQGAWSVSLRSLLCCCPSFPLPHILAGQGGCSGGRGVLCSMWHFLFIHPLPISLPIHGSQRVCNFLIKTTMTYGPVFCSRSPSSGELVINADKSAAEAKTRRQRGSLFL